MGGGRRVSSTGGIAPSVATPRPSSPKTAVSAVAAATATSALGNRGASFSPATMNAVTPRPSASGSGCAAPISRASAHSRSGVGPVGAGRPSSAGAWLATICTDTPARNPVVTGIDSKSATKPSFSAPAAISAAPTSRASTTTSPG